MTWCDPTASNMYLPYNIMVFEHSSWSENSRIVIKYYTMGNLYYIIQMVITYKRYYDTCAMCTYMYDFGVGKSTMTTTTTSRNLQNTVLRVNKRTRMLYYVRLSTPSLAIAPGHGGTPHIYTFITTCTFVYIWFINYAKYRNVYSQHAFGNL